MNNFELFIAGGQIPLHEDCLQSVRTVWLHGLCLASSRKVELDFSFSCMTDRGNEVGGVYSDFRRYLLISEEESY